MLFLGTAYAGHSRLWNDIWIVLYDQVNNMSCLEGIFCQISSDDLINSNDYLVLSNKLLFHLNSYSYLKPRCWVLKEKSANISYFLNMNKSNVQWSTSSECILTSIVCVSKAWCILYGHLSTRSIWACWTSHSSHISYISLKLTSPQGVLQCVQCMAPPAICRLQ